MKYLSYLALLILFIPAFSQQYNPIPIRPLGYPLAPTNVTYNFTIELFIDLLSPASYNFTLTFQQFLSELNYTTSQPFQVLYYLFPMPNNTNSYWATMGAVIISNLSTNSNDLWTYMNNIIQNYTYLTNLPLKTQYQIQTTIASTGLVGVTGITYNQFMTAMSNPDFDALTRVMIKYAISRRVTGAPCAYGNGILIDGADNFQVNDWITTLDNLGIINVTLSHNLDIVTPFSAPIKASKYKYKTLSDL